MCALDLDLLQNEAPKKLVKALKTRASCKTLVDRIAQNEIYEGRFVCFLVKFVICLSRLSSQKVENNSTEV